jgi:hypothetical protein
MMAKDKYADWPEERKARSRKATKEWRARNPEKIKERTKPSRAEYNKAWRAQNPEKTKLYYARYAARQQKWYEEHHAEQVSYNQDYHCRKKYGISFTEKLEMLTAQGGMCSICKTKKPGTKHEWVVDHDHKTNAVRQILCHPCNLLLGAARDDITILQRAIDYLKFHGEPKPAVE